MSESTPRSDRDASTSGTSLFGRHEPGSPIPGATPEGRAWFGGVRVLPEDPHDRELVAQVHPPDWVNPRPAARYNLVVIGAGTAGLVTAAGAAGLGARVALVERALMGGDCLNVGCVPSKALVRSARALADVRDAEAYGVRVPAGTRVDFPAVMERMRRLRAGFGPTDSAARFRGLGVDVFLGEARFADSETVEVDGARLRFARAVIATGARAAESDVPGLAEAGYLTNETVFALTELPPRLAVIGAGPIGCELAQAFARFGSRVTLIERGVRVLPREEPGAAALVQAALVRDGVQFLTETRVTRATPAPAGGALVGGTLMGGAPAGGAAIRLALEASGSSTAPGPDRGGAEELEVDSVLVGIGRIPNVEGLGLEAAGVAYERRQGIQVDDALRTTNSRVYAAGDVCSPYKFTHLSDAMARIAIRNALFPGRGKASSLTLPWCTYTDPEVARVGLDAAQAAERGIRVRTFTQELGGVDRAVLDGEDGGFVRIHVREGGDEILGATVVARHAGEMVSEITLAMTAGMGLRGIGETIHPYPTQAEAIRKVADSYNRSRLTPLAKRVLGHWMRWTRMK